MALGKQFSMIGIILLGTIGVGLWVSRLGKPYHNLLFNLHKLSALAGVVLVVIRLVRLDPLASFPLLALVLMGVAFVSVLGLFISGAILSIQEEITRLALGLHRVSSVVIAFSSLAALYVIS